MADAPDLKSVGGLYHRVGSSPTLGILNVVFFMTEEGWLDAPGKAHFMGVCGVGMAGIAALMAARGWDATGCDNHEDPAMREWLEARGVKFLGGHDAAHIHDDTTASRSVEKPSRPPVVLSSCQLLVRTSAIPENHPEIIAAKKAGIPVLRRGEVLAAMVSRGNSVAVCGTHGKTTTSCMTVRLLQELRLQTAWCVGGHTAGMGGVASSGSFLLPSSTTGAGCSHYFVAESDESDGTLSLYAPAITVLTNIDDDHMEHFQTRADLDACFAVCVAKTRAGVVYNADDPRARRVARRHACHNARKIGFGFSKHADLRAENLIADADGTRFDVVSRGAFVASARIGVPGAHNVMNALAALAATVLAGGDLDEAARALSVLRELPLRRFECVSENWLGARVHSDYAHHPREIAALVKMAAARGDARPPGAMMEGERPREPQDVGASRVLAVFEPHRYSRTRAMLKIFPFAFDGVDALALLPVYAASEEPIEGGGTLDLYREFRKQRPNLRVALVQNQEAALAWLRGVVAPGDCVLLVGAGPIGSSGSILLPSNRSGSILLPSEIFSHPDATCVEHGRLDSWTTFRTPATARWRVEVKSFEAARELLRLAHKHNTRVQWFGMGANTLASDIEFDGVAARFAGNRGFLRDGSTVIAGCGWKGGALLERLTAEGFSGLEFLEGVPGHLGGWLAMNAGAHGHNIGERVAWVRALRADGTLCLLHAEELAFEYRATPGLRGLVAAEVGLRLEEKPPEEILKLRKAFRAKRIKLAGLRCAGSVFKNPPGDFAGRLIEAAGCKGKRIGGARVYRGHANVIALDKHATASDVVALVTEVRECVNKKFGVILDPEIVFTGGEWA